MNTTNRKLNVLKGFACLAVVFNHVLFPGRFGEVVKYASGFAVPIFFMTAGFYAYGKNFETIKRRLFKIINIFIFAFGVFFIVKSGFAILDKQFLTWIYEQISIQSLIVGVCFCTIHYAIPLWYLISMIEVYIFWMVVLRFKKVNYVVKIMPLLFLLYIVWTVYCETNQLAWFYKINFVIRGLNWFLLGYYIHSTNAVFLRKIDSFKLIIFSSLGCVIVILPIIMESKIMYGSIGYIPYALGLFLLTFKNSQETTLKCMEFIGKKLSLDIYIYHVLIRDILLRVFEETGVVNINSPIFMWTWPFTIIGISIVFSLAIYNLKNKKDR